jgi:hypothetical protein
MQTSAPRALCAFIKLNTDPKKSTYSGKFEVGAYKCHGIP